MRCELRLRAIGLPNVGQEFKGETSDPFAVVTQIATTPPNSRPKLLGRTESIPKSLDPCWKHVFLFDWELGTPIKICVQIYDLIPSSQHDDEDNEASLTRMTMESLDNNNEQQSSIGDGGKGHYYISMGSAFFDVGITLGSPSSCRAKKLAQGGIIVATIQQADTEEGLLRLQLRACHWNRFLINDDNNEDEQEKDNEKNDTEIPNTNQENNQQPSFSYFEIRKKCNTLFTNFAEKEEEDGEDGESLLSKQQQTKWETVYKSTVVSNSLDPTWPTVALDIESLCDGDWNRPLRIVFFNHVVDQVAKEKLNNPNDNEEDSLNASITMPGVPLSSSSSVYMGQVSASVNAIMDSCTKGIEDMQLAIPIKKSATKEHNLEDNSFSELETNNSNFPQLLVLEAETLGVNDSILDFDTDIPLGRLSVMYHRLPKQTKSQQQQQQQLESKTFVDYVMGGLEFSVCFAINFTAPNGNPHEPGTLHYLDPNGHNNRYEKAMFALINTLGRFDSEKHYAVWGFGAKYNDCVHNIFQCGKRKFVRGVNGVLKTYRDQFKSGITLANTPTIFSDVILAGAAHAERAARAGRQLGRQLYTILIILTNGDSEDADETQAVLEAVQGCPFSVVFVGIGDGDFSKMAFIHEERQTKKKGQRGDMAHFVHFDNFSSHSQEFTSQALQNIPQQLVDYYASVGIAPMTKVDLKDDELDIMPEEPELDLEIRFAGDDNEPEIKRGGVFYLNVFEDLAKTDGLMS